MCFILYVSCFDLVSKFRQSQERLSHRTAFSFLSLYMICLDIIYNIYDTSVLLCIYMHELKWIRRQWLKKQRGHEQHAAITTTTTTSITTSSPRWDLGACGSGRKLGRAGGGVDCTNDALLQETQHTLQRPRDGPGREPCPLRQPREQPGRPGRQGRPQTLSNRTL